MSEILNKLQTLLFLFLFIAITSNKLVAQKVELGISVGAANYVGDIAPSMVILETKPVIGFFGRYLLSSTFALNTGINFTQITGSDANFEFNKPRNLSFKTNIVEYATHLEFNYFKYGKGILDKKFTSYLFLGLGFINFNPQAQYNGQWYNLRPFNTEGSNYSNFAMIIPFGLGVKWRINKHFAFESSIGFRRTNTDYLDDVSKTYIDIETQEKQKGKLAAILADRSAELNNGKPSFRQGVRRGNADFNDWYVIGNISLTYRIFGRQKCARFY